MSAHISTSPSEGVIATIARCAAALEDLALLKDEVGELRKNPEQTALFATALFDLERARRGDPDARTQLLEVADLLLVFWRDHTGDALADTHPALGPLWAHASALLISFEIKRFKRALDACWEARADAALLQVAITGLQPAGNRRAEFAACLYHLELARLFVDASRAEFARRAGLVHEAYHSKDTAEELMGDDPGLQHLWKELIPYLDEFFEAVEAEQERKLRSNVVTSPGGAEAVAPAAEAPPPAPAPSAPVAVTFVGPKPARPPDTAEPTEPAGEALIVESIDLPDTAPRPALKPADSSGVFDLWLKEPARGGAPAPQPPPPPPSNFTPAPGSLLALDIPNPDITAPQPRPPPPPRKPGNESGIFELNDVVEDEAPLVVLGKSRPSLDVELGDYEPDEATQTFWRHTEGALGLLPPADAPRMDRRALSAEGRAERKKLNGWLDGVTRQFATVPEAKTFACLIKLYMAAQLKEKSLFGGVNAKRKEAFTAALELLSAEPLAAGHCAVWFELDGSETLEHLNNGLEVLTDYLQFCARQNLDPLDPLVPAQFMS